MGGKGAGRGEERAEAGAAGGRRGVGGEAEGGEGGEAAAPRPSPAAATCNFSFSPPKMTNGERWRGLSTARGGEGAAHFARENGHCAGPKPRGDIRRALGGRHAAGRGGRR